MKPALIFAGNMKSGSTTLWGGLKNHPQVCCSLKKDGIKAMLGEDAPVYNYKIKAVSENFPFYEKYMPETYMDMFENKTENTKVFLDGANLPNVLAGKRLVHIVSDVVDKHRTNFSRVGCIYNFRDPWERLESSMFMFARMRVYDNDLTQDFFREQGEINEEFVERVIFHLADEYSLIKRTMIFVGPENMLFLNLYKLNEQKEKIANFLGLDGDLDKIQFGKLNTKFFNLTDESLILPKIKVIAETLKILRKNKDKALEISNESRRKLKQIGVTYD